MTEFIYIYREVEALAEHVAAATGHEKDAVERAIRKQVDAFFEVEIEQHDGQQGFPEGK